ncbi:MAG: thiol-disulfide isomerase/thioredoxin [Glaciecola sp.]|jgi:thiol-disulfide isomerase/thioredoxin
MKLFALTLAFGLAAMFSTPVLAQPSVAGDVWMDDYDAAVKVAKKEGKHLLVDFTGSDWCGWCIKLHEEVFAHAEWESVATKEYVLVALDFPRSEEAKAKVPNPERNDELQAKYKVGGFPTILLMTADGDVFGQTGYQKGGPAAYLTHMAELKVAGLPALQESIDMGKKYETTEGDARFAVWNEVAAFIERVGAETSGAVRLLPIVKEGLTLDPENKKGLYAKALVLLMGMGEYKDEYFTKALTLDPTNASGLYESALIGRIESVSSEETMLSSLEAIKAFTVIGNIVDNAKGIRIYSIAAFFAQRHKKDMVLAKRFAEKSASLGGKDDADFGDLVKSILDAEVEAEEPIIQDEEVAEEVIDGQVR